MSNDCFRFSSLPLYLKNFIEFILRVRSISNYASITTVQIVTARSLRSCNSFSLLEIMKEKKQPN